MTEDTEDSRPLIAIRAEDIIPYRHALWCSVDGGKPHANDFVIKRWCKDGKVNFMLDSHNFITYDADTIVHVVENTWKSWLLDAWEKRERAFQVSRPDVKLENGAGI